MPNITGRVLDDASNPVSGLRIQLIHFNIFIGLSFVDEKSTDTSGNYTLQISALKARSPGFFQIRVRSKVGRLLEKTNVSIQGSDVDVLPITIPRASLVGWPITNRHPLGQRQFLSMNNSLAFSIDNHDAWKGVVDDIQQSQAEIDLQMFFHDIGLVFLTFSPDPPAPNVRTTGMKLETLLALINTRARVRYLIRDAVGAPYPVDTAEEVIDFFNSVALPNFNARRFKTPVHAPMHAKFIVIDAAVGHIVGSLFIQEYFDTTEHRISESRRGKYSTVWEQGPLLGSKNAICVPVHDVSVRLTGSAVEDLRQTFFLHWNNNGDDPPEQVPPPATPLPSPKNVALQVARTLPGDRFPNLPEGEVGMLEAYLRVFVEATDFVYLETQYLFSEDIIDGIRLALLNSPTLEFIIVINQNIDLPFSGRNQSIRLRKLFERCKADHTDNRLGVFALWKHELDATGIHHNLIRIYVHTKGGTADDKWAAVGSSNLDGASMGMTDYFSTLDIPFVPNTNILRESDERVRSVEANVLIFDQVEAGFPQSDLPAVLRRKLWAEHLGVSEASLVNRPSAGWLSLWKSKAAEKIAAMNTDPPVVIPSRALPWNGETDLVGHLKAAGIREPQTRFSLLERAPSFDFTTGKFL